MPHGEGVEMKLQLLLNSIWDNLEEGDIVLFDEFLRGFPEVYNGLLDIITSRQIGLHKLPKVFFVAASNSVATYDKALEDRERGRRVRGASTISQQVAKNLFLWPGQSWFRKGLEAGVTVLIELAWPKRRILEVYLNVAEFGRGTWGVQAASRRFFRKDASRLTPAEAALLAAVLPSPRRYRADAPGPYVRKRQAWIQRQMTALGGPAYLASLD